MESYFVCEDAWILWVGRSFFSGRKAEEERRIWKFCEIGREGWGEGVCGLGVGGNYFLSGQLLAWGSGADCRAGE